MGQFQTYSYSVCGWGHWSNRSLRDTKKCEIS